jgi:hypothetical protein
MVRNDFINNGFVLQDTPEVWDLKLYGSSKNATPAYRPMLIIQYTVPPYGTPAAPITKLKTAEGAPYRLRVFDRQGVSKADIDATFHCIWTDLGLGSAFFTMSTNDPKCTQENLQFGNYVLFEHAELGNWAGVIAPHNQRRWNGNKQVTIPVMAAEYQFSRRRAPAAGSYTGTAGTLFLQFCRWANQAEDALIRYGGYIWGGGPTSPIDATGQMLDAAMATVIAASPVSWWFDPQIDSKSGRLIFNANLAPRRGSNKGYILKEGFNIETPAGDFYVEDGDLVNDEAVLGAGAAISARPAGIALSPLSIGKYGLWQGIDTVSSSYTGTAQNMADGRIATSAEPSQKFMLTALESEESPDTFQKIGVGDIVTVDLFSIGFYHGSNGVQANARIISREYSTEENKVILVNEVVQ